MRPENLPDIVFPIWRSFLQRRSQRLMCALVALAVPAVTVAAVPAAAAPELAIGPTTVKAPRKCRDARDITRPLALTVEGEVATGSYALPQEKPQALVVYGHGYGHTSDSWADHMTWTARKLGAVAVAMDYRGLNILEEDDDNDGLRDSTGWPVMAGAEDMIAIAQHFQELCDSIEQTIIFGVSMGGNSTGLSVALANGLKSATGGPLFDYWIDVEGAVNVIETYQGARALAPFNAFAAQAQADIEEEMGGSFETASDAYREHCVVCRVGDIAASGVKGVVVVHGVDDGLVPYNQGREMMLALRAEQIPIHMYTVGVKKTDGDRDTSATGYVGGAIDESYNSPLAGHASETSWTHPVMATAFEALRAILNDGTVVEDGETPVNEI
ncbi:MAG: prolyl oligopeptidase family serine peptidase [Actinomycetota bacterium]